MKHRRAVLLLLMVALAMGSLSIASVAHSASWYDSKILSTQQLQVLSVEGTTDLTTDWKRVFRGILDRKSGDPAAVEMLAQFDGNRAIGSGWLAQSAYQGMRVITFDPDATISFDSLHLTFSKGRVCVWETGGHSWKNWKDLDASPKLENYVSIVCDSYDAMQSSYTNYNIGLTDPPFLMPYLFIASDNLQYPSGYEGVSIRTTEPGAKYVAMGDSFSSGEGNPPFEIGTDVGGDYENRCHRSPQAYPRLLQDSLNLGSTAFVACSGATTADVLGKRSGTGNWNEGAQVDALSEDTEVVTITIGGNDVGFSDYVTTCVFLPCGPGSSAFDDFTDSINSTGFLSDLKSTYEEILTEAPNADVYVAGYPHVIDSEDNHIHCILHDRSGATLVVDDLNSTIALAVAQVRSQSTDFSNRMRYVSATSAGSPFEGKQLCAVPLGEAWFKMTMLVVEYSLHPNVMGQSGYRLLVEEVLAMT